MSFEGAAKHKNPTTHTTPIYSLQREGIFEGIFEPLPYSMTPLLGFHLQLPGFGSICRQLPFRNIELNGIQEACFYYYFDLALKLFSSVTLCVFSFGVKSLPAICCQPFRCNLGFHSRLDEQTSHL